MAINIHSDAWSGLDVVILASSPVRAMNVEQQIADADPALESKVYSFERYEEAYDHCMASGTVGLLLICDDLDIPLSDVVDNLIFPYEQNSGFPGFATILYEKIDAPSMHSLINGSNRVLKFISLSEFMNAQNTKSFLNGIWLEYLNKFQELVFPPSSQTVLLDLFFDANADSKFFEFQTRLLTLSFSKLNLSWFDCAVLGHASYMVPLLKSKLRVFKSLGEFERIFTQLLELPNLVNIRDLSLKKFTLVQRTYQFSLFMTDLYRRGEIEEFICSSREKTLDPFAGAFEKIVRVDGDSILALAADSSNIILNEAAG